MFIGLSTCKDRSIHIILSWIVKEPFTLVAPKAFMSHASEDKERFVLDFATKLRNRGIDVWLDHWEMKPGDSLIDKIFNEGIKNASAFIIVLSAISVSKPWVREELNAATVRRINQGGRLIPVIIDNCEVPVCLQSTLWVRIDDLSDYSNKFDSIVATIFGHSEKPPLGPPPAYAEMESKLSGLSPVDAMVLEAFCEAGLARGALMGISTQKIWEQVEKKGVPQQEFLDALELLAQENYLERGRTVGMPPPDHKITSYGFETYAREHIPDYAEVPQKVASKIVNEEVFNNRILSEQIGTPKLVIDHILEEFELYDYVTLIKANAGLVEVRRFTARLKRALESGGLAE